VKRAMRAINIVRAQCAIRSSGRPLKLTVRPHMRRRRYAMTPLLLMSLTGCIEITTYVSPSASGTVIDAVSQKPIQGATISVDGYPGLFAQTNSDGQFQLSPDTRRKRIFVLSPYESLPPSGTVVVSADGYASKETAVKGRANSLVVSLNRLR
jgi:hypothetical protein